MSRIAPDDIRLWRRAMQDVAPLPGRSSKPAAEPRDRRHPVHPSAKVGETPAIRKVEQPASPPDRATAERLKRGRYPVEATLDLHGMTQTEAHRALRSFITGARACGKRCVLVVTGHGRISGGVLKAAVPRWLAEPELRQHLLATATARPQHGGSAALYLLLRRVRSERA